MKQQHLLLIAAITLLGANSVYSMYAAKANASKASWVEKEEQIIQSKVSNINPAALHTSLVAYSNALRMGLDHKPYLTIIDFSKPSTQKRLWVINLKTNQTLFNTFVSHGKNSGGVDATSFSNRPGSLKSSIGVYVTADTYFGKNGYSLRLRGLDRGFNDNAFDRDIVMHGAKYVNTGSMGGYGSVGRSWGCPAVNPALAKPIIDTIKGDSVIVAYYPDHSWLTHSQFLTG